MSPRYFRLLLRTIFFLNTIAGVADAVIEGQHSLQCLIYQTS